MPRVLVNVVQLMEIHLLKTVKRNTLGCSLLQRFVSYVCIFQIQNEKLRSYFDVVTLAFQPCGVSLVVSYNGL